MKKDTIVIRPFDSIERGAVVALIRPVEDVIFPTDQSSLCDPVPDLVRPFGIRGVPCIPREPGSDIEEPSVGDGVAIRVAVVEGEDLPIQSTTTGLIVPARDLLIEDRLRHGQPRRRVLGWVGEIMFGRHECGKGPEGLVIVALGAGLVGRHKVTCSGLVQDSLHGDIIVGIVAGISPVVDQGAEKSARFPPVVGGGKVPRDVTGVVASVEADEVPG